MVSRLKHSLVGEVRKVVDNFSFPVIAPVEHQEISELSSIIFFIRVLFLLLFNIDLYFIITHFALDIDGE